MLEFSGARELKGGEFPRDRPLGEVGCNSCPEAGFIASNDASPPLDVLGHD